MRTHGTGFVTRQRQPRTPREESLFSQCRMTAGDFLAVMIGTALVASLVAYACMRDSRGIDSIPAQLALPMRP